MAKETYQDVIKAKLSSLIQNSVDIKNIYEDFLKEIGTLQKQRDQVMADTEKRKTEWAKTVQEKEAYLAEFDKNLKKEREKIENDKREAKSVLVMAQEEKMKYEKLLKDVTAKEKKADEKIAEVDLLKKMYESKIEKIKALTQQV